MYIAYSRIGTKIGQSSPSGKRNVQTKFKDAHDNICQLLVSNSNDLSHKLKKKDLENLNALYIKEHKPHLVKSAVS